MNKKIWWGLIVILVGLFYLLQQYIPEAARYILNYQVLFILIGIFFFGGVILALGIIEKKKITEKTVYSSKSSKVNEIKDAEIVDQDKK